MTLKDAIENVMVDLNSYQIIHVVGYKSNGNKSISYSISIALINEQYIFRVEADENIIVHDYQVAEVERAKTKLIWLINKYSLNVEAIFFVTNMQLNELLALCYQDNILTYSIESKRITRKEMLIRYTTVVHPFDFNRFVEDFEDVLKLVQDSCRKYDIEIVLRQEHPQKMVRRMKLANIELP